MTAIRQHKTLSEESLGEKFETIIQNIPDGNNTLLEILEIFEDDGLLLLSIFLALIFLVPISIPGVSTVFGTAILLIGVARLFNRHLWLPDKIANRIISAQSLASGLSKALVWFHRLEKITLPHRLQPLTQNNLFHLTHKVGFIFAAILLMVPFGFIPFSNTLPALALIFLALGELQKDGGSILLGHISNLATIIYFGVLVAGSGLTILEGLRLLPF